jgi:hypothetical protein
VSRKKNTRWNCSTKPRIHTADGGLVLLPRCSKYICNILHIKEYSMSNFICFWGETRTYIRFVISQPSLSRTCPLPQPSLAIDASFPVLHRNQDTGGHGAPLSRHSLGHAQTPLNRRISAAARFFHSTTTKNERS